MTLLTKVKVYKYIIVVFKYLLSVT